MTPKSTKERVLILAPHGRDAQLAADVLIEAGLQAAVVRNGDEFLAALAKGGGAGIVALEALGRDFRTCLAAQLAAQPTWSDFPILIFTARSATASLHRQMVEDLGDLGNITTIERPLHPSTLVSAVKSALRARRRQYQTRDVLEQRELEVRQRDQFLAMLGHELRNPLAAITNAKALVDRAASALVGVERPLAIIDRQVHNLHHMVDDLLDVARVTSGKIALKVEPINLNTVVRNAIDDLCRSRSIAHLHIDTDLSADTMQVLADPVRIEQIIGNIFTNAIKYTPAGGHIAVTLDRDGNMGRLRIQDSGVGMSRDILSTVFEPFTQADRTLERAQGGMGLGLTVVRTLVELHGGTVHADSRGLGRGSTFTVRLPLLSSSHIAPASTTTTTKGTDAAAAARHILIVEDSADIRDSLQELLQTEGHRVDVASDGEQGVQRALALRPDIALVDIGLPRLDGYAVARRVRASIGQSIFLVALTGYGQPEDRTRAYDAGFDVHLTKPVEIAALDSVLANADRPPAPAPALATRDGRG